MGSLRAMSLRAVAFGDVGLGRWGAVVSPGRDLPSFAVLGTNPNVVLPVVVEGESASGAEWWVTGEGLDLAIASEADVAPAAEDGFDQLVTVRGELPSNGAREVDLLGCRGERTEELVPGNLQLLRDVRAWFSLGEGLACVALRPRRASGHADERVSATIFEAGQPLSVAEPRLSTTYSEDGLPIRATLELWLPESEEEQEDLEADAVSYPRRAAGAAVGPGVTHDFGPLKVHARAFQWRAAGRDGTGVYLLAWVQ
jgi:hypothetical protein